MRKQAGSRQKDRGSRHQESAIDGTVKPHPLLPHRPCAAAAYRCDRRNITEGKGGIVTVTEYAEVRQERYLRRASNLCARLRQGGRTALRLAARRQSSAVQGTEPYDTEQLHHRTLQSSTGVRISVQTTTWYICSKHKTGQYQSTTCLTSDAPMDSLYSTQNINSRLVRTVCM